MDRDLMEEFKTYRRTQHILHRRHVENAQTVASLNNRDPNSDVETDVETDSDSESSEIDSSQ
jgi:hypothetical protein